MGNYMLQVAESVLPKPLRDGAYKVIAKAEDLLRKRDGWVDWQNSIARREAILMHTDGTMKLHSSMQDNFLDVFGMINCTASLFRMSCPFLHAVYCVLSRYVNIVKVGEGAHTNSANWHRIWFGLVLLTQNRYNVLGRRNELRLGQDFQTFQSSCSPTRDMFPHGNASPCCKYDKII